METVGVPDMVPVTELNTIPEGKFGLIAQEIATPLELVTLIEDKETLIIPE